ncbi:MAG TPA: hypothetical protein VMY99_01315 [Nevskiaceae bacterium]|nr:hypothetical protein [Nevskiaceae bacterium]
MADINEVMEVWGDYISTIDDWELMVKGIEPKVGGCGLVYEVPNPIDRPQESFAIADMRQLELSEPHSHANGEVEIYFIIAGVGKIAVEGENIQDLSPGARIYTPSGKFHITLPGEGLVMAVVNTPPFNLDNYIPLSPDEESVASAITDLKAA